MSLKEKLIFELNNLNKVEIVENFYTPQVVHKLIYRELIISVFIAFFISLMIISIIILHQKAKNYKKSIT
jgi:type IV secretory pathway component VirB8